MLLTVGHSNHDPERFLDLIGTHAVDVIADVRSWPRSRFAPWSDREALPGLLADAGRRYVFLGDDLGGRPDDAWCYDSDGHVLYGRVSRSACFQRGLNRLRSGLSRHRVAAMCSEEDPATCHRRLLVAKILFEEGIHVVHIRGDGTLEEERGVMPPAELGLFDDEDTWWRSSRSVSRRPRPVNSSRR